MDSSPVVVKRRLDGTDSDGKSKILTSLYICNMQWCMVAQSVQIPEEVSVKIMTEIAEELCMGRLEELGLCMAMDKKLVEKGLAIRKKLRKMPQCSWFEGALRPQEGEAGSDCFAQSRKVSAVCFQ